MWQRARSDDQIEKRVKDILDAAAKVFRDVPYEKVTMQMIAKEASFTRSNIYRYFRTREEIFFTLYLQDVRAWKNDILKAFQRPLTIEKFVDRWTKVLLQQERLLQLSAILTISLEKNTSRELYRRCKLALRDELIQGVERIKRVLPMFSDEQLIDLLAVHMALVAGGWPMCQYNETQLSVLNSPELAFFKLDFPTFYRNVMLTYLKGMTTT